MRQEIDPQKFITWLKLKQLSDNTIKEYMRIYKKFNFEFDQQNIDTFLSKRNDNITRAFLSNLFRYIIDRPFSDEIKKQIALINIPKRTGAKKRKLPDIVTEAEAIQIANAMTNERNSLMTLITFYAGLRIQELIRIKVDDFNWATWIKQPEEIGTLKVTGKGNKQRQVFIPQNIMSRIYQWIRNYISKTQHRQEPIFQIKHSRWWTILAKTSQQTINKKIHPHALRHGCATWLMDKGWDLIEIKEYLGHESIQTTQIYTHLNKTKLKQKYQNITNQNH